jgi:hypothetical protein
VTSAKLGRLLRLLRALLPFVAFYIGGLIIDVIVLLVLAPTSKRHSNNGCAAAY